ncbi:7b5ab8b5-39a3-4681-80ff-d89b498a109b [Sclerotinia trifoliorum]|uniref:7b5ab8b5-39a3-4681-80ff-d89b498a109b n=1 Tax=Sclerotinia trifoliorum TaxID=28548 RepID=A0A8H2ZSH8_9HELO|nr:7b5ab8b5-39a3-4681-80ff-d89b498a109b [Sclerotinia trifoliorum]
MALSTFAAKGLELAERGSFILYGAGYFTEEEWVELDALLHRGKYVFTNGPQTSVTSILDDLEPRALSAASDEARSGTESNAEEDLLIFDEPPEDKTIEVDCSATSVDSDNEVVSKLPTEVVESHDDQNQHKQEHGQSPKIIAHTDAPIAPSKTLARSSSPQSVPIGTRSRKTNPSAYIGKLFVATKKFERPKEFSAKLEVSCGDKIQVVKHVSGNEYRGVNQRTGLSGHFDLSIITADTKISSTEADGGNTVMRKAGGFSMDEVDRQRTAEWENESEYDDQSRSVKSQKASDSGKARKQVGSLGGSRFASLADIDHQSVSESEKAALESVVCRQKTELERDVVEHWALNEPANDDKKSQIVLYCQQSNSTSPKPEDNMPRNNTRERLRNKPYEIVVPKTEVCYFWSLPKGCRYTEAQCRDLHEEREYTLQTNLRNGKPNPGALFDSVREIPSPAPGKSHQPAKDPSTTVGKRFTCFFWDQGGCRRAEKNCDFLHTYVGSGGILLREVQNQAVKNRNRKLIAKPKFSDTDNDAEANGWGESSSGWGSGSQSPPSSDKW